MNKFTAEKHSRRRFIKGAAAGGAGLVLLKDSRSAFGYPANETVMVAHIGVSGQAGYLLGAPSPNRKNVAALCDVNEQRAAAAYRNFPDAPKGRDYRVMFDKLHKQIDAVIVGTGDYGHAPASAAAIKAGKPVYCEKPLTVAVNESRGLARLAAEHKVITQMGNQGGYDPRAVNMVWSGMLGDVLESHNWIESRGADRRPLPAGGKEIPRGLHWDLWLGPSPYREYDPAWMSWLMWREFGTSLLGNRGSHSMATMFKALKIGALWPPNGQTLDPPKPGEQRPLIKVTGECSELCIYSYPRWEKACWQVPAREGMPPVKVYWHMGERDYYYGQHGERAKLEELLGRPIYWGDKGGEHPWGDFLGSLLVGTKGKILCGGYSGLVESPQLAPKGYREQFEGVTPPNMLPEPLGSPGTSGWMAAVKGGPAPMCSFDAFSGPYSEFQLLAHVSTMFPGEELEFDPLSCRILNNSLADRALVREYRPGWSL